MLRFYRVAYAEKVRYEILDNYLDYIMLHIKSSNEKGINFIDSWDIVGRIVFGYGIKAEIIFNGQESYLKFYYHDPNATLNISLLKTMIYMQKFFYSKYGMLFWKNVDSNKINKLTRKINKYTRIASVVAKIIACYILYPVPSNDEDFLLVKLFNEESKKNPKDLLNGKVYLILSKLVIITDDQVRRFLPIFKYDACY